jgi:ribitol 2-dehydrogenase
MIGHVQERCAESPRRPDRLHDHRRGAGHRRDRCQPRAAKLRVAWPRLDWSGLECARALSAAGATVVLIGRAGDGLAALCTQMGPKAVPLVIDLTNPVSVATMMPLILAATGQLDMFHTNAGSHIGGDVVTGDPDARDRVLNPNISAAFRPVQAVSPHMVERQTGAITLTSSIAGIVRVVTQPIYTASKFALQAFMHTVRRRVAKHGIRVMSFDPGPVVTALLDDWPKAKMGEALATGSLMQPRDVADAVLFMLTRQRGVTIRDLVILPQSVDV